MRERVSLSFNWITDLNDVYVHSTFGMRKDTEQDIFSRKNSRPQCADTKIAKEEHFREIL